MTNNNEREACSFWKDGTACSTEPWVKYLNSNYEYVDVPVSNKEALYAAAEKNQVDVLVIGGGFSGVQAATTMNASGLNTWLVEALPHLGGRCTSVGYTDPDDPEKTARFDCGAEYLGLAQRALWTYVTKIYPQFRSTLQEKGQTAEPDMGESTQKEDQDKKVSNPKGLKDLTGEGRPNRYGNSVEVIDFKKYSYQSPPPPPVPEGPHIDPYNAGVPAAIPTSFNFLRDMTPVNTALIFAGMYSSMINVKDIFFEEQTNPKMKFSNTIVPELKKLDQITIDEWVKQQNYLPKPMQDLVNISVVAPLSLESSQVSALAFMEYAKLNGSLLYLINDSDWGPQQYIMKSSFQTVCNTIAAEEANKGRIVLSHKVVKVEYDEGEPKDGYVEGATVSFEDGKSIHVKQVVVAMSPWTAGLHIDFTKVSTTRKEYQSPKALVMGKTIKLFFVYDKPWWRDTSNGRPEFIGYSGSWGNTNEYNQKYSKIRVGGKGVSSTQDEFNPATVIWTMDNSHDEQGIYALMTFIVADQVKKVQNEDGVPQFDLSKQASLQHFYEFFDRDPEKKEDRELVEGANLKACFGGCWDENGFIGGGPDAFPKVGTITNYESKLKTQGVDDSGAALPIWFTGSELSEEFRGYMSGAISGGNNTAFTIIDYMAKHVSQKINPQVQPYYDIKTKYSYYQQFETIKLKDGKEISIPQGYLDIDMAPSIQVYSLFNEFKKDVESLNVAQAIDKPTIDPFASVNKVASLVSTITSVPNPGLFPEQFRDMAALERATNLLYYFVWGNFPAMLQLCAEDAVLECPGPEAYKKVLPFLGKWKGTDPNDPNGIMGFFIATMVISETLMPYISFVQEGDENVIIFHGGSYIVPAGYEYDPLGKEGTDWVFSDTMTKLYFSPETGYCTKMLVIHDNLSILELLKNNNQIEGPLHKPVPSQNVKHRPMARIKSSTFRHHSNLLNLVSGVKYVLKHVEESDMDHS